MPDPIRCGTPSHPEAHADDCPEPVSTPPWKPHNNLHIWDSPPLIHCSAFYRLKSHWSSHLEVGVKFVLRIWPVPWGSPSSSSPPWTSPSYAARPNSPVSLLCSQRSPSADAVCTRDRVCSQLYAFASSGRKHSPQPFQCHPFRKVYQMDQLRPHLLCWLYQWPLTLLGMPCITSSQLVYSSRTSPSLLARTPEQPPTTLSITPSISSSRL